MRINRANSNYVMIRERVLYAAIWEAKKDMKKVLQSIEQIDQLYKENGRMLREYNLELGVSLENDIVKYVLDEIINQEKLIRARDFLLSQANGENEYILCAIIGMLNNYSDKRIQNWNYEYDIELLCAVTELYGNEPIVTDQEQFEKDKNILVYIDGNIEKRAVFSKVKEKI